MVEYTNECCGCAVPGYPCLGNSCSLRHVPHYYCDICGDEIEGDPHIYDGVDMCEKCYRKEVEDDYE